MKVEIEFSERRLEKKGFSYEGAANTVKTLFKQRGVKLIDEDISLIFEGNESSIDKVLESLDSKEWFKESCVLCEKKED